MGWKILRVLRKEMLGSTGNRGHPQCYCSRGPCIGLAGAGVCKPSKIHLPKAEPFSEGAWCFALFLPPDCLSQCSPTSSSWCRGQRSLLEVSPIGAVSGMWEVGDWLQKGWMPAGPCQGLGQQHQRLRGRWNHLGQVASVQWSLAGISYLGRE